MRAIRLLTGLTAALLAFAVVAQADDRSPQSWLENYYQQPNPDRFPSAVVELSRSGYFAEAGHVPLAIGFCATLFAQHPERVDEWLAVNRVLPVAHQRILLAGLWLSGHPRGASALRESARHDAGVQAEIAELLSRSPSLAGTAVLSPVSMNVQWGAFLASGDATPVRQILTALGSASNTQLSQEVRWSLAQNAVAHPRVLNICRDELTRQPNAIRETLRAVINETEAHRAQPTT